MREGEKVDEIITFGGSALKGKSFTNILAIFSDSNNSKQKIIAYYRNIYFSSEYRALR